MNIESKLISMAFTTLNMIKSATKLSWLEVIPDTINSLVPSEYAHDHTYNHNNNNNFNNHNKNIISIPSMC